ncbi:hypothetical protein AB0C21_33250 [Spirillospora sp. NPDC049024]
MNEGVVHRPRHEPIVERPDKRGQFAPSSLPHAPDGGSQESAAVIVTG